MQFNEVYDHIGHFGYYQLLIYIFCGVMAIVHGYQVSAMIFLGMDQDYFCKVNDLMNFSYEQQQNIAIPMNGDSYSRCEVYDLPWEKYTLNELVEWNRTLMTNNVSTMRCSQWNHVQSTFVSTVVSQFDLVCGRGWYVQLGSTMYTAGMLVSSLFSGIISDRFGRKMTTVMGIFLHPAMALAAAFSPYIELFCVFRFFTGVFAFTAFLGGYVMIAEIVGQKYVTYASMTYNSIFAFGVLLFTFEAYFVRDHLKLQLDMAIPLFLTVAFFWVMPESARWLHAKGRTEEATEIVKWIAVVNGKQLPDDFKLDHPEEKQSVVKRTIVDLFRYSVFRKTTLLNFFIWFANSLVFYGIGLSVGSLVGDIYINTFLTYFVDIPANTIAAFLAQRIGRKKVLCAACVIAGLSNLVTIPLALMGEPEWPLVLLNIIGRGGASAAFCTMMLITAEQYPTEIRHVALGTCSVCARVAGMLAPYLGTPLEAIWISLPSFIFGVFGLMSAFCVMMLRETLNRPMPDRVEDLIKQYKEANIEEEEKVPSSQLDLTSCIEEESISEGPYVITVQHF